MLRILLSNETNFYSNIKFNELESKCTKQTSLIAIVIANQFQTASNFKFYLISSRL